MLTYRGSERYGLIAVPRYVNSILNTNDLCESVNFLEKTYDHEYLNKILISYLESKGCILSNSRTKMYLSRQELINNFPNTTVEYNKDSISKLNIKDAFIGLFVLGLITCFVLFGMYNS